MAGRFLRVSPAFRIMRRSYMPHFRDRGFVAGYVDALLRAGVPGDHDGPAAAPPRRSPADQPAGIRPITRCSRHACASSAPGSRCTIQVLSGSTQR
jgi:hypothetical protein